MYIRDIHVIGLLASELRFWHTFSSTAQIHLKMQIFFLQIMYFELMLREDSFNAFENPYKLIVFFSGCSHDVIAS